MLLKRRLLIISILTITFILFLIRRYLIGPNIHNYKLDIEPVIDAALKEGNEEDIKQMEDSYVDFNNWDQEQAVDNYIKKIIEDVENYQIPSDYLDELYKLSELEITEKVRQMMISKQAETQKILEGKEEISYNPLQSTMLDNKDRKRSDQPPDNTPWAKYETHRMVKTGKKYDYDRENAVLFTLCRTEDLFEILSSIRRLESRFNSKYHYDWVFLNDKPFTDEFVELTSNLVSGRARYGLIPREHWSYPHFIDQDKAKKIRESKKWSVVMYGSSESYRHMCRFNSMFFYKHPILQEYQYYWRVEPEVNFHCDILYDPFKFMRENGKKYGFNISMREIPMTIETLWKETRSYFRKLQHNYFDSTKNDNMVKFISDDGGESYNLCHYWTNFEIADFDIYRNDIYEGYVNTLDKSGGFFYERWGDAPIHSIIFSLILNKDEVHLFQDISYEHTVALSCPIDAAIYKKAKCTCNPLDSWIVSENNCNMLYLDIKKNEKPIALDKHFDKVYENILNNYMNREERKTERIALQKKESEKRQKLAEQRRQKKIDSLRNVEL